MYRTCVAGYYEASFCNLSDEIEGFDGNLSRLFCMFDRVVDNRLHSLEDSPFHCLATRLVYDC